MRPAASIMVGDMESDRLFAHNAGISSFAWAGAFFRGAEPVTEPGAPRASGA